ncbi:hypothetical protein N483_18280 [Pseudoalteromonas luteoviolacea NCIMB 1944]|nr:hypothetical protein N483_18280 [Pseudoalteromonas luteoviolacea NCIMB 1944]
MQYVPIGVIYTKIACYIAARAYEDTRSMNVKAVHRCWPFGTDVIFGSC